MQAAIEVCLRCEDVAALAITARANEIKPAHQVREASGAQNWGKCDFATSLRRVEDAIERDCDDT